MYINAKNRNYCIDLGEGRFYRTTLFLFPLFLDDSALSLITEALILAWQERPSTYLWDSCGLVSFGHAGFFAVGAYTFGLLSYYHLTSFWFALLVQFWPLSCTQSSVGWFVVRLVEIYFALLCLAFAQIIWVITSVWYGVTGGDDGLTEFHS